MTGGQVTGTIEIKPLPLPSWTLEVLAESDPIMAYNAHCARRVMNK